MKGREVKDRASWGKRLRLAWRLAAITVAALFLAVFFGGCVSKAKADAQARAAFLAGQQQAAQQMQMRGPNVTVLGEVRNGFIPWTAGLTLAKAVVAAGYYGATDPAEIIIIRNDEQIRIEPAKLLNGEDFPLQPRDIIELKR